MDLNPLATLVAAFAGAWGAFLFESRRKAGDEKERQRAIANRSLYVISEMWNVLYQYYQDVVKPMKGRDDAWLNMAATASYYGQTQFDAQGLAFLLDLDEHQTYPKIILEEMRYRSVLNLVEMRNEVIMNLVHPALAATKIKVGTPQLIEEYIESVIGIDNAHKLRKWTPEIMGQVEKNLHSLKEAHNDLRAAMKRLQPDKKFIELQFKEL